MTISDVIPVGRDGLPDVDAMIRQGRSKSEALKIWAVAMLVPDKPPICMTSPPKSPE